MANENHHRLCPIHHGGACQCGEERQPGVPVEGVFGDPDELIVTLTHAVFTQHRAIDHLMARLIAADPTFRPTQWTEVWQAVELGHKAAEAGLRYRGGL